MGRLEGKVAFVTGAGRGQGRSHAVRLAEEGADIIATDLCAAYPGVVPYSAATEDDLAQTKLLVEKTGQRCVAAAADVRRRAALQTALDEGVAELGHLDIVIANAGVCTFHESSLDIDEATYDLVVDTCQKGVWNTIQVTAPLLIRQGHGGAMVLTSSAAGLRGHAHYAHYSAAKHAVVGLMRSFANELAPRGIRVNSVHPTGVDGTGMGAGDGLAELAERSHLIQLQAMNMLPPVGHDLAGPWAPAPRLEVDDISAAVVFLASDEARFITGVTLPVDGGNTNKP